MSDQALPESKSTEDKIPALLESDDVQMKRAITKWVDFNKDVFSYIKNLGGHIQRYNTWGSFLRVVIIVLSATITTLSDIDSVPRTIITVIAGIMTIITGVEGYYKFTERSFEAKKTQRELEELRDKLRYAWFVDVEIGSGKMEERLESARKKLRDGPAQYNEVLTKYVMESEKAAPPEISTG